MPPKKKATAVKDKKETEPALEVEEVKAKKPRGRKPAAAAAAVTAVEEPNIEEPPKAEEPPVVQESSSKGDAPPSKAQKGSKSAAKAANEKSKVASEKPKAANGKSKPVEEKPKIAEEAPKRTRRAGTARTYTEETTNTDEEKMEQKTEPTKRGKKAPAPPSEPSNTEVPAKRGRKPKADTNEEPEKVITLQNQTETAYDKISFECSKKNKLGELPNFCIASWNVDGLRAWTKKDGLVYIEYEKPDIFCIQESKCSTSKLPPEVKDLEDYEQYWHNSEKEGYAGVGTFSRIKPLDVQYGIGIPEHDDEGRCVTLELDKFYLVNVYVPNAGRKLVTLPKRLEWNKAFKSFIKELDTKKPVIICGDMNVAHTEIDLANPKSNTKNAGFTKEEREGMTEFLADGYVDTYREFYPDKTGAYTFWTYMMKSRSKNVGWRLDYFLVSEGLLDSVCDIEIRSEVFGSDHCPIALHLNV